MRTCTFAMRIALAILTLAAAVAHADGPGEKLYNEFVETGQIYGDEAWQSYVRRLGERLLSQSKDAGKQYHFHVLDNSVVNAFATGDRYIFINRGLIAFLRSEDELAAVVGHEIGHVVARHTRRQRTANIFGKGVGIVAAILTGAGNLYSVSDAATKAYVSGYGREMELEADRLGGEYLARAGYNPLAMIDVVQVLKDQELFAKRVERRPSTYHGLFASHPKNDKRLHDAVAYAQNLLPETTTEPVADFWDLVDGLMYGDEAVMGRVIDRKYYHGGLRVVVEFPEQWTISNPQAAISATAPGGRETAYIEIGRHPWQKRQSPEKFLTQRLRRDDIVSGEAVEINGMEGYVGETSTEGSDAKLKMIGVLYRGKDVFLFTGAAGPKGDPETFRQDFLATMHALRNMTPEDAQLANERRIKVIVAEPDVTYADLARNTPIRRFPEETLRLMNAGHPHGEPRAGNYIKIVQ